MFVFAEDRERYVTAADSHHPAGDQVSVVPISGSDKALKRLATEIVIRPDEEDIAPACRLKTAVGRRCGATRVLLVEDLDHGGVLGSEPFQEGRAAVGRAVIDRDDLHAVTADGLIDQRFDALLEVRHRVVHRKDDAHIRRIHTLGGR